MKLNRYVKILLVIAAVLLAALPVLTYPMGRDQGMYANIALDWLRGGTPFVTMWDIKPPPVYYIYALGISLFGVTTAAVRAVDFLFVPFGMLGIFFIGERIANRRVGLLSALLYGVFYFNEDFPSLSQNDSLVTVLMIGAAWFALRAMDSKQTRRYAFLVGALCGLILWFKHYFAFFVAALVINQIIAQKGIRWREAAAFTLGGLLTGGGLLFYFGSQGMIAEMLIVAQGTAAYNAQGYDFGAFIANMSKFFYFKWLVWSPLIVLAALWLPTRLLGERGRGWRLVLLWFVSGAAFLLIQAKGFDTHWIPMLPPLALLGADALDRLVQWLMRGRKRQIAAYGAAALFLLGMLCGTTWGRAFQYMTGQESRMAYFDRFQANDLKPEQSLQVAQYLQQRTTPGDTLFIYGFRPEVYYMANLRPATRYQAHFPLVAPWYPPQWKQQNVEILWAAMPPYVLVLEDDYMPWVTDSPQDSHQLLQNDVELNNWLIANYERVDEIGDFIIWQRKS